MKPIMRIMCAVLAMFALSACGGGGGATPVADRNTPKSSAPPRAAPNTDPAAPPESINWRYDLPHADLSGSYVAWDGTSMSMRLRHKGTIDIPTNAVLASFVPLFISFSDGVAWGAVAGDREPIVGEVYISLNVSARTLFFDFEFPERRLDHSMWRDLAGWQWRDSNGAGAFTTDRELAQDGEYAPTSIYGVERYNTFEVFGDGVPVEVAYWSLADDGTYGYD